MSAGLMASIVTPDNGAPAGSLTEPTMAACADAVAGRVANKKRNTTGVVHMRGTPSLMIESDPAEPVLIVQASLRIYLSTLPVIP